MRASLKGGFWALVLAGAGLGYLSITAGPPVDDAVSPVAQSAPAVAEPAEDTAPSDAEMASEAAPEAEVATAPEPETAPEAEAETAPVVVAEAAPEIVQTPQADTTTPTAPQRMLQRL